MSHSTKMKFRHAAMAAAILFGGVSASADTPSVKLMPGKIAMLPMGFDIAKLGYQTDEYFLNGTATSYKFSAPPTSDGQWQVAPAATAPYANRIVVMRPSNPARFNGTVLVEWFNVTAGSDTPADWMIAHREMIRKGYAYVGVTAQKVGIDGGGTAGLGGVALKKTDPARYGSLVHPGDAFSYDIFSQAGALVKSPKSGGILGPLVPKHVIAIGESQSAGFLTSYVNAVDPVAHVYDGFFVHSRFGGGSSLGDTSVKMPDTTQYRKDLRVPVLTLITETDLTGGGRAGYQAARRPDYAKLRVWELAGAAHADNYLFGGASVDSGMDSTAALAKSFVPTKNVSGGPLTEEVNPGMPHHYVVEAAIAALDSWVRTGKPPASTPLMELAPGASPTLVHDANGLTKGGVRTPWTDVPTIRLSGVGDPASFIGRLAGKGVPFDKATLAKLYPGGKADYMKKFTVALDAAIKAGHILPADRREILDIAAMNYSA